MRRTFSISPSRSIAGMAHSSPMVSAEICWKAATNPLTLSSVDPAFGVGDKRDGELVHPGIAGERAAGELRQLPVVAARQALPYLADVLLDHVVVVQQPLTGGARRRRRPRAAVSPTCASSRMRCVSFSRARSGAVCQTGAARGGARSWRPRARARRAARRRAARRGWARRAVPLGRRTPAKKNAKGIGAAESRKFG